MTTDLKRVRFVSEGQELSQQILEDASKIVDEDPRMAAQQIALAWGVVNAAAMVAADSGMFTKKAKIESLRYKIKVISGELVARGFMPTTMPIDNQLAFSVTPVEKKTTPTPPPLALVKWAEEEEECEDE